MLTPFIFDKIKNEFELREKVHVENKVGNVYTTQSGYNITTESCTCPFFTAMNLPCKHIMKIMEIEHENLFLPSLCAERWTKSYFERSHPAIAAYTDAPQSKPIHISSKRIPSEIDKYKKIAKVSKEICNLGSGMATDRYQYFMEKMARIRDEMSGSSEQTIHTVTVTPNATHVPPQPNETFSVAVPAAVTLGNYEILK